MRMPAGFSKEEDHENGRKGKGLLGFMTGSGVQRDSCSAETGVSALSRARKGVCLKAMADVEDNVDTSPEPVHSSGDRRDIE